MLVSYVLVPVVPRIGVAFTNVLLTRPSVGLFTVGETVGSAFGHERYQYESATHRRALRLLILAEFFLLFVLTLFLCDRFLVNA